jgi:dihydroorotate dehydrogenase
VDHLLVRLAHSRERGVRGISIGKNLTTPIEQAERDYVACLIKAYPRADYIAVNVSSPNTARLRELQGRDGLDRIVGALQEERERLAREHGRRVPLLVKVAPNLDPDQVRVVAAGLRALGVDGVIATNTSNDLSSLRDWPDSQRGGLSGAPLHALSLLIIAQLRAELPAGYPIIGVGGIMSAEAACATLRAGANLLQVYTGFAYRGQALISEILAALTRDRPAPGAVAHESPTIS